MNKKKTAIIAGAVAAGLAITTPYMAQPLIDEYATPIVQQKLHSVVNGQVSYSSLAMTWNGNIAAEGLTVKNANSQLVAHVDKVTIDVSYLKLIGLLLGKGEPENVVAGVIIDKPELYLQENEKGQWNISNLIKENKEKSNSVYKGYIVLQKGKLHAAAKNQHALDITNIQSKIDFSSNPSVDIVASFHQGEDVYRIVGQYNLDTEDGHAKIHSDKVELGAFSPYIPESSGIQLRDGTMHQLDISLAKKDQQIILDGQLDLENLDVTYKNYSVKNAKAKLKFKEGTLFITKGEGLLNDQEIHISGSIGMTEKRKELALELESNSFATKALPFHLPIEADVRGRISVDGTRDNFVIHGHLLGTNVQYDGKAIPTIETDIQYKGDMVYFDHVDIGKEEILGQGEYDISTKEFSIEAQLEGANMTYVGNVIGTSLGGTLWGNIRVKGNTEQLQSIQAEVVGTDISYEGILADSIQGSLYFDGKTWAIPYITGTMANGSFAITGTASSEQMNMTMTGDSIALSNFQSYIPVSAKGNVTFAAEILGTMSNPDISFDFGGGKGVIRGYTYYDAVGNGRYTNGKVYLEEASFYAADGRYDVAGEIDLLGNRSLNMNVHMDHVRLEDLIKPLADISISGWISNDTKITGTLENPIIEGKMTIMDGAIYGELIQNGEASYIYDDKGLLVKQAYVSTYGANISGSGSMTKEGDLNFIIDGDNISPGRFLSLSNIAIDGNASLSGNLKGTIHNPIFNGSLSSQEMSINGESIRNISGQVYYDPTVINFRNIHFTQHGGDYTLSGGYRFASDEIFGSANAKNGNVGKLLKLAKIPLYDVTGDLQGTIEVHGTTKNPDIAVNGTVYDTTIMGKNMGTSNIDVGFEKDTFTIRKLRVPIESGFIVMQGNADFGGQADIEIASKDVPITYLLAMAGVDIPVSGILNGIIKVTGNTKAPTMQLSSNIAKLTYNDTTLDNVYLLATSKDGIININQLLAEKANNRAKMSGIIPFKALYKGAVAGKDTSIKLELDLQNADLSAIPLFLPMVEKGEGKVKGKLEFTGVAGDISVNGDISTKNGTLWIKDVAEPVQNVDTLLHFAGHKAEFNGDATMGGGQISLDGEANWTNNTFDNYYLKGYSKDVTITSPYFKGPLQGNIFLKKGNNGPVLGGYLNLNRTMMIVPISFETTESNLDIGLDFTIEATENARLYNSLLYDLNVQGEAHFGGTTMHPDAEGRFSVTQGTLKYLNNQFKVTDGVAEFNQTDSFLPSLTLKAETTVDTYTIKFGLEGPLSHMTLHLSSSPALSEQQIIALLTVRKLSLNDDGVEKNAINSLVTTGLQMVLLGDVENSLKEYLALDEFKVTQSYLDPFAKKLARKDNGDQLYYYSLSIGKELFKDFMVTFGTGLNYNLSRFGMSYQLSKHVGIDTWFTTDHNSYVGLQYKYRF